MPGRRAFLRRRHVAAAATRQVIIDVIEARRARLGVMRRWRPSARASRPRSDSGRRQVIPVRGGTEPPAGRSGACAARAAAATAPLCEPQSPAHSGSGRSEPRPSPETLGPPKLEPSPARQHQAPTGAGQRGRGALSGPRPASRSGPEHDTCGRYSGYSEDITADNVSSPGPRTRRDYSEDSQNGA